MVVVVDYKCGNGNAILNMLKFMGIDGILSSNAGDIENARRLILPGIGAFDTGMMRLMDFGLVEVLNRKVVCEKIPILGICLGMQLMTERSEEGKISGFGWIEGETIRFCFDGYRQSLKIPHMGWNHVRVAKENPLTKDLGNVGRFYFVHSYHVVCRDESNIITTTRYGYDFVSGFQKNNIIGVQFHPEKSHKYGMKLLKNFWEL